VRTLYFVRPLYIYYTSVVDPKLVSFRIRIRSQVSVDLDPDPGLCGSGSGFKYLRTKSCLIFTGENQLKKICIHLSPGLYARRPSYSRSLQPQIENNEHPAHLTNTFCTFRHFFLYCGAILLTWILIWIIPMWIRNPADQDQCGSMRIRIDIHNTASNNESARRTNHLMTV
jgi:hypothetical protein